MKLIIIGAGPAGISAALYAKRSNIDTTIIHNGKTALEKAHIIDNYYGAFNISGMELYEKGIKQAKDLGIDVIKEEVLNIEFGEKYKVVSENNDYEADAIIIATGSYRNSPLIKNIKNFEGKGVSYCATCDGFFYKDKTVGVLGTSTYAYHEANYLKNLTKNIYIFTNGKEIEDTKLNEFKIINTKIKEIDGENNLGYALLSDDQKIEINGLFIALGSAGSIDLAKKLGIETKDNRIVTNENMATNLPGIYACGDCTKGMLQISKAVYEGALAATDIIKFLKKKK